MPSITVDGTDHPVTVGWHTQNVAPYPELGSMTAEDLAGERDRLLALSVRAARLEPGAAYGPAEEARLQAVTRVHNAHRATRMFMGTRALSDFGFEGVDQLHGNRHDYPCGCSLHVVFDHHRATAGLHVEHHPHVPFRSCGEHAPLASDFRAHHARVVADSQRPGAVAG